MESNRRSFINRATDDVLPSHTKLNLLLGEDSARFAVALRKLLFGIVRKSQQLLSVHDHETVDISCPAVHQSLLIRLWIQMMSP